MSYYCQISFKKMDGGDIFGFFQHYKDEVKKHMPEMAADNYTYSPYSRNGGLPENITPKQFIEAHRETEVWAGTVFRYRWFYLPQYRLLGVFSVHDCLEHLFDANIEFQNSSDQDYGSTQWEGVSLFEQIYEKWMSATEEEVFAKYSEEYGEMDENDGTIGDYYRKTFAYNEIWDIVGPFLENDSQSVYLSLFGSYETHEVGRFASLCIKLYDKRVGGFERQTEGQRE